jgi:hypothetical protein
MNFDQ